MKTRHINWMALFLLLCACQPSQKPSTEARPPLSDFSWLEGCWTTEDGKTVETWTIADATHGFAVNYSLSEDQVSFFEFSYIDKARGDWAFHAYPRGIGPSTFPIQSLTKNSATFANDAHDYPQSITYTRDGKALQAKISLINGEKPFSWTFLPCPEG